MSIYAEALAKLRSRNPTPDTARWEQAKHDAALFLEQWGETAQACGWTAEELFGLDPTAPLARYDKMGVVWLMQGKDVQNVTAEYVDFGVTKMRRRVMMDV